jgi:outer membrane protein assembly factor BamB
VVPRAVPGCPVQDAEGRPAAAEAGGEQLRSAGAGAVPLPTGTLSGGADGARCRRGNLSRGADAGPGLPRRRLLLAGVACVSAAGLGGIVWEAGRPRAATLEAPVRRAAIWLAEVSFARPRVMAAAGGVVCVAGDMGAYSRRDAVQALNASDGTRRWTFTARVGLPGTSAVDPPGVAVSAGRVYVAVNRLAGLRASDGARLWTAPSVVASNAPVAGQDAVYVAPTSLFAVRGSDGARLWSFPTDANSAPVLVNGVIYLLGAGAHGDPALLAIRASDGTKLWDSPGPPMGRLACDGHIVCAVSGSDMVPPPGEPPPPSQLWTWRASDGRPLWRSAANAGFGQPAMAAGIVYAPTSGELLALRPSDGRTLWSYPTTAPTVPVAAHGRIYTRTFAHELVALNASDGTPVWHFPARFTLGPVVAGDTVYVSDHTTVYAVRA